MLAPLLAIALQVQAAAPVAIPADAYADSATADLVARAREARERNERLVTAYTVRASSRLGVGIRALSRDRMLYRQEMVVDITWRRDSISTATVVGAREGVPIALKGDQIPNSLRGDVRDLIIDPGSDFLRVVGSDDDDGFSYPLRDGAELDYRYAREGVTSITLADGRRVEIVGLRIIPRRADFRLVNGTFWFDNATANLVRAVFRPARPFELRRDLDPDEQDDIPGWVNAGAEVKYVTLEYGLYENRWWMPRYMGIDAVGSMGSWLSAPFRMERVYQDYEVTGGEPRDPESTFRPAGWVRPRDPNAPSGGYRQAEVSDSIQALIDECMRRESARIDSSGQKVVVGRGFRECRRRALQPDSNLTVVVPDDTLSLLTSAELGEPILAMGDLIIEEELLTLRDAIGDIPDRPWSSEVVLPRGASALLRHARYNRIEALSLGLAGGVDFGRLRVDALARIGVADGNPNVELALVRPTVGERYAIRGYRRLAAANPAARPFGPINSFMALVAGRDDGQYYRTRGIELTGMNADTRWWEARLYHERQLSAAVETRASLPGLFDGDRLFRPNITADRATQTGGALTLRTSRPLSRVVTVGLETTIDGSGGDFDYGRGAATARFFYTQGGPMAASFTVSAGTSTGDLPVQGLFYLGGPSSLRGYAGGVVAGTAYWYGRAEVGNSLPAARLIGFTDIGWAGHRSAFSDGGTLIGAGVGASFVDGLFRIDLSRALRTPTGWRLDFYVDGAI